MADQQLQPLVGTQQGCHCALPPHLRPPSKPSSLASSLQVRQAASEYGHHSPAKAAMRRALSAFKQPSRLPNILASQQHSRPAPAPVSAASLHAVATQHPCLGHCQRATVTTDSYWSSAWPKFGGLLWECNSTEPPSAGIAALYEATVHQAPFGQNAAPFFVCGAGRPPHVSCMLVSRAPLWHLLPVRTGCQLPLSIICLRHNTASCRPGVLLQAVRPHFHLRLCPCAHSPVVAFIDGTGQTVLLQ